MKKTSKSNLLTVRLMVRKIRYTQKTIIEKVKNTINVAIHDKYACPNIAIKFLFPSKIILLTVVFLLLSLMVEFPP